MKQEIEPPEISIYSHQKVVELSGEFLDQFAAAGEKSIIMALELAHDSSPLTQLDEVEVSIIDDQEIADVHLRFMDIPGATDVITFDHGEIHISIETARSQSVEYGNDYKRELVLYMIHGLLHLAGYGDATEEEFTKMDELQQSILNEVWR